MVEQLEITDEALREWLQVEENSSAESISPVRSAQAEQARAFVYKHLEEIEKIKATLPSFSELKMLENLVVIEEVSKYLELEKITPIAVDAVHLYQFVQSRKNQ